MRRVQIGPNFKDDLNKALFMLGVKYGLVCPKANGRLHTFACLSPIRKWNCVCVCVRACTCVCVCVVVPISN